MSFARSFARNSEGEELEGLPKCSSINGISFCELLLILSYGVRSSEILRNNNP
jgi:hypothetical protein